MGELAARYLRDHVAVRCKPRTADTSRSVVNLHTVPALGKLSLAAVERSHVTDPTCAIDRAEWDVMAGYSAASGCIQPPEISPD